MAEFTGIPHIVLDESDDEIETVDSYSDALHSYLDMQLQIDRPVYRQFLPESPSLDASVASLSDFETEIQDSSHSSSNFFNGEDDTADRGNRTLDLFHSRAPSIHGDDEASADQLAEFRRDFRVSDEKFNFGFNSLELGLGLGWVIGDVDSISRNPTMSGGDPFEALLIPAFGCGESSEAHTSENRIVEIGSDSDSADGQTVQIDLISDSEEGPATDVNGLDESPVVQDHCLEVLQDSLEEAEYLEWEEVDDRSLGTEVLSMVIDDTDVETVYFERDMEDIVASVDAMPNAEWLDFVAEVNFTFDHNSDRTINHNIYHNTETYLVDHDDFYDMEYDMIFGQFADTDNPISGSPPAAISVIENLPLVVLTQKDVANNNTHCAICKDEISLDEQVRRLPCTHHYHGDCILPWLRIRNTCPVCRFELPTDDPDHERLNARRARRGSSGVSAARYDSEMLSEIL